MKKEPKTDILLMPDGNTKKAVLLNQDILRERVWFYKGDYIFECEIKKVLT